MRIYLAGLGHEIQENKAFVRERVEAADLLREPAGMVSVVSLVLEPIGVEQA